MSLIISKETRPTPAQRRVLQAVCDLWVGKLRPPTYRELMAELGFASPMAVHGHFKLLLAKGLIELVPGDARSVILAGLGKELRPLLRAAFDRKLAEIDAKVLK